MGFGFLRQILSKRKQDENKDIEEIKLASLSSLIDAWSKDVIDNTNSKLAEMRAKIAEEISKTKQNIKNLENAELKNKNIPKRALQIMEGNRKTYEQKITLLMKDVYLPDKFDDVLDFCKAFDEKLELFGKSTVKNYYVLQEFFGYEIEAISNNINNLGNLVKKVKKTVEDSGINKINQLKDDIGETQQKIKQKTEIKEDIRIKKEEIKRKSKEIKEIEEKIKNLEDGGAYKKFSDLLDKKKSLICELGRIEKQASDSFFEIKTALKKYERLTLEDKLIRKYLDNPVKAVLDDEFFKISEHIPKIKEFIASNKIELKDIKKKRILRELDNISKKQLESFSIKHNELNNRLNNLNSEIEKTKIISEIEELKEKLRKNKTKLEDDVSELDKLVKILDKINIEVLIKNLEKKVLDAFGKKISLNC